MKNATVLITVFLILITSSIAFTAPKHPIERPAQQEESEDKKEQEVKKKRYEVKHPTPKERPKEHVKQHPAPKERPKEHVKQHPTPKERPKEHVKQHPAPKERPKEHVKQHPAAHREKIRIYRERERSEWRQNHRAHRPHSIFRERFDYRDRHWFRQHKDWEWFGILRFGNVRVYTDHHSDTVIRVHLDNHHHPHYFDTVTKHYGHHQYKKRWHHHGQSGWAYFWMGHNTIIRVFVGDDGYVSTVLWHRAAIERYLLSIGYISEESLGFYGQYYNDMPSDLAGDYIEDLVNYLEEEER